MITTQNTDSKRPCWYFLSKNEDNINKFIDNDYWEYYENRVKRDYERDLYRGYLKAMQIGDKIAVYTLKSETRDEFIQKNQYEIHQRSVPYIMIKAIGKIVAPCKDNKIIEISCQKVNDSRRWYHHTYRAQIWKLKPRNNWCWRRNLIDFTFNGAEQNLAELKDVLTK